MRVIIYLLLATMLQSCWPLPGKGKRARSGYHYATIVIAGLERFNLEHGRYPDSLSQLLYNDSVRLHIMPKYISGFNYKRIDAVSYELNFGYTTPGLNWCIYHSKDKKWHCGGLY